MKLFCYAGSIALLVFALLFLHAGFYPLGLQALALGVLFSVASWLMFRKG